MTPLPPKQTFLDDPLRVLRAIRFGIPLETSVCLFRYFHIDTEVLLYVLEIIVILILSGARFGFLLDEELKVAAADEDVKTAIADKISRERIGHEVCFHMHLIVV